MTAAVCRHINNQFVYPARSSTSTFSHMAPLGALSPHKHSPRKRGPAYVVFNRTGARVSSGTGLKALPASPQRKVSRESDTKDTTTLKEPPVEDVKKPQSTGLGLVPELKLSDSASTSLLETPTKYQARKAANTEDEWQDIEDDDRAQKNKDVSGRRHEENSASSFLGFSPASGGRSSSGGKSRFSFRNSFGFPNWNGEPSARQQGGNTSPGFDTSQAEEGWKRERNNRRESRWHARNPSWLLSFRDFWLDPGTPVIMAAYLQLGFNLTMLSLLIFGIITFYTSISNDVNLKVEEYSIDIVNEMAHCSQEYLRNNCQPSKRVPALETVCTTWEHCMNRDPRMIGRAKVSAETFGEIIESFLRPIGLRSMIFLVLVFAGSFILVNGVFASKISPRSTAQHASSTYPASSSRPSTTPSFAAFDPPYSPSRMSGSIPRTPLHRSSPMQQYYIGYQPRLYSPLSRQFYGQTPRTVR